jgi:hypothetical protein
MPSTRKTTKAALAAAAAMPSIPKELIDQFVTGPMSAEAVNAASMAFKKALIERALGAEQSAGSTSVTSTASAWPCVSSRARFRENTESRCSAPPASNVRSVSRCTHPEVSTCSSRCNRFDRPSMRRGTICHLATADECCPDLPDRWRCAPLSPTQPAYC